jgi:hypothetical protein
MNLSTHFTLDELVASQTATRLGLDNTPSTEVIANLTRLAQTLEMVRYLFGAPIVVSSGYRAVPVNAAVGGVASSKHCIGCAVDFIVPMYGTPLQVAQKISASSARFDQLIHEFGHWVHLGISVPGMPDRMELLTIDKHGTRPGLLEIRA